MQEGILEEADSLRTVVTSDHDALQHAAAFVCLLCLHPRFVSCTHLSCIPAGPQVGAIAAQVTEM